MTGLIEAFKNTFRAIPFLFRNRLGWTVFVPPLLSLLLFVGANMVLGNLTDAATDRAVSWLQDFFNISSAQWLAGAVWWIITLSIRVAFFFVYIYTAGAIILVLLSPLLAWVSEKTEERLTGRSFPFEWRQFVRDIRRGVLLALRNLALETGCMILAFIIGIIPVINVVTAPVGAVFMLLVSSYFYGFSNMDYCLERHRMSRNESVLFVRRHRGIAIGTGIVYALLLLIPIVGAAVAGVAALTGTVGAVMTLQHRLPGIPVLPGSNMHAASQPCSAGAFRDAHQNQDQSEGNPEQIQRKLHR
jgi:CysZ protein